MPQSSVFQETDMLLHLWGDSLSLKGCRMHIMQVTGEFHLKKNSKQTARSCQAGMDISEVPFIWCGGTWQAVLNIYVFLKSISPSGFFQENHLFVCNHCDYCVDPLKPPVNVIVLLIYQTACSASVLLLLQGSRCSWRCWSKACLHPAVRFNICLEATQRDAGCSGGSGWDLSLQDYWPGVQTAAVITPHVASRVAEMCGPGPSAQRWRGASWVKSDLSWQPDGALSNPSVLRDITSLLYCENEDWNCQSKRN